ncbi:unnamed protein product [Somion occarium]|uniref:Ubiquitin-like protease family profile domain-containing protein n=1 Tax=Somion occarium TaxID=3059160 RepID=A0ABP1CLA0_9APHY
MNPRKRPASETLLPLRAQKVPRRAYTNCTGATASPSQDESLLSRWSRFGEEFSTLMIDTVKAAIRGFFENEQEERANGKRILPSPATVEAPAPPPPPPPPPRRSSSGSRPRANADQPIAGPSRLPQNAKPSHIPPVPMNIGVSTSASKLPTNGLATGRREDGLHQTAIQTGAHPDLEAAIRMAERAQKRAEAKKTVGRRQHIFSKAHKAQVVEEREKLREEMEYELYKIKRASGYESDFKAFRGWMLYTSKLEEIAVQELLSPSRSLLDLRQRAEEPARRHSADEFLARALQKAKLSQQSPPPPKPFTPTLELLRVLHKAKDEEIEKRLHPVIELPPSLPPEEEAEVDRLIRKRGVIAKCGREQVSDKDISRLLPNQWLNDEIINFYGQMILSRSEGSKENPAVNGVVKGRRKPLNVHYFNTFFWSKLKGEGYEKARLAKWTKKIDIFTKDAILIPINHMNAHWTAAAINFRKKRIESYDSMSMDRAMVFKLLRGYLDAEHRNKKKKPFDFTGWEDYEMEDIPQQENGFDCGVFTCQFLESLSRGEERFPFRQRNMPYLRRRMIWEIGHARLRDSP